MLRNHNYFSVWVILLAGALTAQDKTEYQVELLNSARLNSDMIQNQMIPRMMSLVDPIIMDLCHFGCPGFVLALSKDLSLSGQQVTALEACKTEYQKFFVKKKAEIKIVELELSELMNMENPDFDAIKNSVNKLIAIENEMKIKFINIIEASRSLLTEEQLQKLRVPEIDG
ncbi:MAG: hypothetical protein P8X42_02435 [Calditrichaceae bacterium]|jgi:hypothetical protein